MKKPPLDDELLQTVLDNCDRNEIRLQNKEAVVAWARGVTHRKIMLECVRKGHIEIVGWNGIEPSFRITEKGQAAIQTHEAAMEIIWKGHRE